MTAGAGQLASAKTVDRVWAVGRVTIQPVVKTLTRLRIHGMENIPRHGPVVLAMNHLSWIDPPAFGAACPRTVRFLAKVEAHRAPGLGHLIRSFGTLSVRRGESDREAVRLMREVLREGGVLGLFVEGTRQRHGGLGPVQSGAAMAAIQEDAPVVCGAIRGSYEWRLWNFNRCEIRWGRPLRLDDLPRNARGYREGSARIAEELRTQWEALPA
jgi:1-acyl-sn-glycerol-3-phosphate acyltransferase